MPRNAFNQPNAASGATGGGQSTNIYAGGVFELEPDEALIIESRIPVPPQYIGFHLANLWGESLDFANRQTSLNGFQVEPDADGVLRYVVAHRDPGVPNWLDTTGHREGFLTPRWAYSEQPPPDRWPTIHGDEGALRRDPQTPAGGRAHGDAGRARRADPRAPGARAAALSGVLMRPSDEASTAARASRYRSLSRPAIAADEGAPPRIDHASWPRT